MKSDVMALIEKHKIIVIMRGIENADALKTAQALYNAGIRLVEYAYDGKAPDKERAQIIHNLCEKFDGRLCIGAGTVTTPERLELAINAGASYIISPDVNREIIQKTVEYGLVSMPGGLTPTEIQQAAIWGADYVKIFPITAMPTSYIKDIRSPLSNIKLIAVGGVDANNMNDYMEQGAIGIGVGSNITNKKLIQNNDFDEIKRIAKQYVDKLQQVRR